MHTIQRAVFFYAPVALSLLLTATAQSDDPPPKTPAANAADGDADSATEDKQFVAVADRYWKILRSRPRRDTAFDLWYRHYLDAGKLDDLLKTVQTQALDKPNDYAAQLLLGLVFERRGQDAEALAAYSDAEQLAADNYYPRYLRGTLLARQQRPDEAAAAMTKALSLKPSRGESLELYKRLARLQLKQGKTAEALRTLGELSEKFPDDRQVLEELAQMLAEEQQFDEAIRRWEQVAALAADDPQQQIQAKLEIAQLKLAQGRRADSLVLLNQALDQAKPDSWLDRDIRRRVEQSFTQGEDAAGLVAWCEARLRQHPQDLGSLLQLARALDHTGKRSDALARYGEAVELARNRRDIRESFIEALVSNGKLPEAVAQCQLLADKHPQDPEVLLRLGQLQLAAGMATDLAAAERQAIETWQRVAALRPTEPGLALQVAEACRRAAKEHPAHRAKGEEKEPPPSPLLTTAEKYYREALRRAPQDPQYHEYLGEFLHAQKRRDEAIAAWSQIGTVPESSAESWHRLAAVYAGFEYLTEAASAAQKALEFKPNDFDRHDFRLGLELRRKNYETALTELDQLDRLATDPTMREKALKRRLEVYEAAERVDVEIARLEQATRGDRAETRDLWLLGLLQSQRGQHAVAVKSLAAALQQQGDNVALVQAYAEVLKRASDVAGAIDQYRRLAGFDARMRYTYYQEIIQLELQRGRPLDARKTADLLIQLSPGSLDGYRIRADVAFRAGDAEQGLRDLRQAVKIAPRDVDVRGQLARALAERGQRDEALEHYWRSFELADNLSGKLSLVNVLADVSMKANKADDLVDKLRRLRLQQQEPKALTLCLAEALVRLRRTADAERELVALADSRGDDLDVLRQLASLAERTRNWPAAVAYQERVVGLDENRANMETLAKYLSEKGDAAASAKIWQRLLKEAKDDRVAAVVIDRQLQDGRLRDALALCELRLAQDPESWRMLLRAGGAALALDNLAAARAKYEAILALGDDGKSAALTPATRKPQPGVAPQAPPVPTIAAPAQPALGFLPTTSTAPVATQGGMRYVTTASGQTVLVAANGAVISQFAAPAFAPSLPEAQELLAARNNYARIQSTQGYSARPQSSSVGQPSPSRTVTTGAYTTTAARVTAPFPIAFPDELEGAKLEATTALWAVAGRDGSGAEWLNEQAAAGPKQMRRAALACSASGSAGQTAVSDLLDSLIEAQPMDPLPHLVRLYPGATSRSLKLAEAKVRDRWTLGLHASFAWIAEHRPAAKKDLSYYLVMQLMTAGDSAGAAEAVGQQLAEAKSFDDLGGLPIYIGQSADAALLRKLLAWSKDLAERGGIAAAAAPQFRMVLDQALVSPLLSAETDFETVAALIEGYLALDAPSVASPRIHPYAISGAASPAPAMPSTVLSGNVVRAVPTASTAGLSQAAQQQALVRQRDAMLLRLQALDQSIAALPKQSTPTAATQLQTLVRQRQTYQQELQRIESSVSLFPGPNAYIDADRLDVLGRYHAWLKTRGRIDAMQARLAKPRAQAKGSKRYAFELAAVYLNWWSNDRQQAVEQLGRMCAASPDDANLRLALAQALYSHNDLPRSLAELDKLPEPAGDLAQPMQQLRGEIRRRWSDLIKLRDIKGHSHVVRSLAFSPDGKRLLSGSFDRSLQIWDVKSGKFLKNFAGHTDLIFCVAWSPTGNTIASSSYNEVRLWDVDSSQCTDVLTAHAGAVRAVAFSPDGKLLATAGDDSVIRLWNVLLGEAVATLEGHADRVNGLAFSPDGATLASASNDKTVRIWNVAARTQVDKLTGHSGAVTCVAYAPDGLTLATGGDDQNVMLWRLPVGKAYVTLQQHTDAVTSVAFSPDGHGLASASADRSIKLWNLDFLLNLPATLIGHGGAVSCAAYSRNGSFLASASHDELIKIWDLDASASTNTPQPAFPRSQFIESDLPPAERLPR